MNRFFNPTLLIAIALHAVLLWFPLSSNSKSQASKSEEAQSETAAKPDSQTVSNEPSEPIEASATAPSTSLPSPAAKNTSVVSKSSRTLALPASQTRKIAAAPPSAKTTATTQTVASRPAQKPTNASRTMVSVPKTVPTFTTAPPFSRSKTTPQPSSIVSPAPAPQPSSIARSTPAPQPSSISSPTPAPQPSSIGSPTPAPQVVAIVPTTIPADPFTKLPVYPLGRSLMGSMGLQPWERERETYAFNTREEIGEAIAFYEKEIPKDIFEPLKMELDGTNMTIYAVKPKNGGKTRYLHFIPFQGRTAILLLPEKISDLGAIKAEAIKRRAEQRQFLNIFSQMERIRQQVRTSNLSQIE